MHGQRAGISIAAGIFAVAETLAQEPPPRRSDLLEHTVRGLAQLDVTVEGPLEAIADLERRDFVLIVGGRSVEAFEVDRQCAAPAAAAAGERSSRSAREITPPTGASYLFYFDQHHLTLAGRLYSFDLARQMIERLVADGSRAAIVSAGRRLATFAEFTEDHEVLIDALARLDKDKTQFDDYPALEEYRQRDVLSEAKFAGRLAACARARQYQREELSRTESALALFAATLGRFVEASSPRVVVYFADTARLDAGQHYFRGLGCSTEGGFDARAAFRHVAAEAAAMETRVYAVQAEGLVAASGRSVASMREAAVAAAQSGLKAIALDTGGDAFLNGAPAERMARRIAADAGCVYLLSFDPQAFPEDEPLTVRVDVTRPKVRARTRSLILFQSEGARRMSRLLAAFAFPEGVRDRLPVGGAVVPLGFEDGRYTALVQAVLPVGLLPREEWDVGISVLSSGTSRDDVARRISLGRAGVRAVLEAELSFRPGAFEVVLVGQENASGRIATGQVTGVWPDRADEPALGPLAMLQPAAATFVRGDQVRSEGSLALAIDEPVRADRPLAFVGLVCRGSRKSTTLAVVRALRGERALELPPLELVLDPESCAQVRDLVPADTLAPGQYTFEMRVAGTDVVTTRAFRVAAVETPVEAR